MRILTGRNQQYKKFFRSQYFSYNISSYENIRHLRLRLKGGWQPSDPDIIYLPKPSGLQRPITLLRLEDQIVLQAIANIFSDCLHQRRNVIEHKNVFSNILDRRSDNIFFLKGWRDTYSHFQQKSEYYFAKGYRWIGTFDLAAFYDTIPHSLLINRVAPKGGSREAWDRVRAWLKCWSSTSRDMGYDHGIPQGPLASDFLAECFLLPIDEEMVTSSAKYLRYVDDVRLMAKSREFVQEAAIKLEVLCREQGLIPQSKKFSIHEATNLEEVIRLLPSLSPSDMDEEGKKHLTNDRAAELFLDSLAGRPYYIADKSKARYVLFRAPRSYRLLKLVLRLLPRHPEHIDAFSCFLMNYSPQGSVLINRTISTVLKHGSPYSYVRGELWRLLAEMGTIEIKQEMLKTAKRALRITTCTMEKWGCLAFIMSCRRAGVTKTSRILLSQSPLVKALVACELSPEDYSKTSGLGRELLSAEDYESGLAIAPTMCNSFISLKDLGLLVRDIEPQVQNVLRSLGLITRRRGMVVDQIGNIIAARYDVDIKKVWRKLLGTEYYHALTILVSAESYFKPARSEWLKSQNSFNDILLRQFIYLLKTTGLQGVISVKDRKGKMIPLGNLLYSDKPLSRNWSMICDPLRQANNRRNTLPSSHPYDRKTGKKNSYLSSSEQKELLCKLAGAYKEMMECTDHNA